MDMVRTMTICWIVTPIVAVEIPAEEGGGVRRYPRLCFKDKYPCLEWAAVFFDEGKAALVRFVAEKRGLFEVSDCTEKLETPEQWLALYQAHPELKNLWSDQP